ncbi:hypothetical protein PESP_a0574 [Pseudoalteromonas espejiana DSM 9414]|nr:hypothetical protein PESP_a0574 [Pseudoalteromonas espejiana DSM 9414]
MQGCGVARMQRFKSVLSLFLGEILEFSEDLLLRESLKVFILTKS